MPPASAPLRLDGDSLRQALKGSEGAIRKMARNSGAALESPRPTESERLARAVAQTGKPDCLAPQAGGSLLSIPAIALMAVMDKCK